MSFTQSNYARVKYSQMFVSCIVVCSLVASLLCPGLLFAELPNTTTTDVLEQLGQQERDYAGEQYANLQLNQELQEKLDALRVERILDTLPFLEGQHEMIGENEWQELELDAIVQGWQPYTKTKFDEWGMKKLLRHAPHGSKGMIRYLVENDEAFERLNAIMDSVQRAQHALIAYWDDMNTLHYDAEGLYYSFLSRYVPKISETLNNSVIALEFSQALAVFSPVLKLFAALGVNGLVSGFASSRFYGTAFDWKESFLEGLKRPLRNHNPKPVVYKDGYKVPDSSFKGFFDMIFRLERETLGDKYLRDKYCAELLFKKYSSYESVNSVVAGGFAGMFEGLMLAWSDYNSCVGVKNAVESLIFLKQTSQSLQNQLVTIATLLKSLQDVPRVDFDSLVIESINKYISREGMSSELGKLFDLLNASTFESESSFLYSKGILLYTHKLFKEIKEQVVPLLQQVALLGGYRAIAQAVRAHKHARVNYCFVEFVDKPVGPYVNLKNAWMPLLAESEVVTNDIVLGAGAGARNAVVTGPNGGGKSTSMITVAFNILLSRLGIAAAEQAVFSKFEKIRTSLRPQQDIGSGLSSFMAEHKRVAEVKNTIYTCEGNVLVLLDEPYKGTVEVESATRVYAFGKEIAEQSPHCMLLLATHLRKPVELEVDTCGLFTNFQMGYIETKVDLEQKIGFKRTFKLQPGAAIWWFDDAEKRARFIDWLCSEEI